MAVHDPVADDSSARSQSASIAPSTRRHDGQGRFVSIDPTRVARLIEDEETVFRARRNRSRELWREASTVIPRGVASSFQDTPPQPIFIDHGAGSHVVDVDGNDYIDFHNGFGAMLVGHAHPAIVAAVSEQIRRGSHFAQPVAVVAIVAAELQRRFHQPQWRFCNSGTEATLDAVRLARGFTGRERVIKIEGSYHGHHDALMVSVAPPPELMGDVRAPIAVPFSEGIPRSTVDLITPVPFNDPDALARALASAPAAAVVVEPAMMNLGFILPDQGYLDRVRDLARRHGALLIFDEVKTGVAIAAGGATERFGVVPDLVCLAKSIGGGLPCGAIGGRDDVMATITQRRVAQMGTFNGNPLTMAASRATLCDVLTPSAYASLEQHNSTLTHQLEAIIARHRLPFQVVAMAARGCVVYTDKPVRNYRDYLTIDRSIPYLSWLYQVNRGVLMAPGAEENWTISVQHTEGDVSRYAENFAQFADALVAS